MIVFHGSPNYFGKFKDSEIGSSRDYNPIHGHYFSEDIKTALMYKNKYTLPSEYSAAFLSSLTQNISGYLYICEVPSKNELLDLSMPVQDAPGGVQDAIRIICTDGIFYFFYMKVRENNTIGEFINQYRRYCRAKEIYFNVDNIYRGYKGVVWKYGAAYEWEEIIIFSADDIKIKQCFIIDTLRSEPISSENNFGGLLILFKRFGEYYYAEGAGDAKNGIYIFSTDDDCPEIVDEVQSLQELERNPFVIAYIIQEPINNFFVTEANVSSLNYNLRKNTRPEKASIYSVDDILEMLKKFLDIFKPVKSKILNLAEFAEYQRQADKYKDMGKHNPFIFNAIKDRLNFEKTNALLLQRADKPYFEIKHQNPESFAKQWRKRPEPQKKPEPIKPKKTKRVLTDEQIRERNKAFVEALLPIVKEKIKKKIKKLRNLPETQETPPPSTEQ